MPTPVPDANVATSPPKTSSVLDTKDQAAASPIPSDKKSPSKSTSPTNNHDNNRNHKSISKENSENYKMFKEIEEYEKSILVYKTSVAPLLSSKSTQFESLFKDYLSELTSIIKQQSFTSSLEEDIIQQELKKYEQAKQLLFNVSSQNAGGAKALEKQIDSRKNTIFMEKRIIKVQSVWRGVLVRRNYQKRLKREFHRNKIANEILETERVYVKNLELMVTLYYLPLKEVANSTSPFISLKEVNAIFSNIELILNVNKQLLASLEDRIALHWSKFQKIGDIFLRLAPFLKLYVQYVNNYNVAILTLSDKLKSSPELSEFMTRVNDTPVIKTGLTNIQNFQILPIQRTPRYELLLKDFVKYTDEDHPDFKSLCEALFKVQDVAKKINESKRLADNLAKIISIQEQIGREDLVQPHRRFLAEGSVILQKKSKDKRATISETLLLSSNEAPGYIYLFSDLLLLLEKKAIQLDKQEFKLRRMIPLEEMSVEPLEEFNNSKTLAIISNKGKDKSVIYYTKENWFELITKTIRELHGNKSSLKLESPRKTAVDSLDALISKLPTVPSPMTSSTHSMRHIEVPLMSSSSSNLSAYPTQHTTINPSKLNALIPLYEQVFNLESDLFKLPIQLESLIPAYSSQLPHNYLLEIYDRLQELKKVKLTFVFKY
jgi:hypothetical protein